MSNTETTAELFKLALAAEQAAEDLYLGLEAKFAHQPEVAGFWGDYAKEEVGHARWLESVRDKSSPEQLSSPADPSILNAARNLLRFSPQNALEGIKNLEDAYQLANELEHSEINVVFEFIITNFASDASAGSFLRAQLRDHIARLVTDFPARFTSAASRLALKALE